MDMYVRRASLIVTIVAMILAPALPASSAVTTTGYWRFDEGVANTVASGAGSIIDSSGSGDDGTPSGGPIYRTDVPPSGATNALSLQFDGVDDQVAFGSVFPFHQPGDAALDFWLKFTPDIHRSVFWTRIGTDDTNRFNIFVNGNGTFGFDYRSPTGALHKLVGDLDQGITVPSDTWTHLVISRTGNTYSLFRNGSLVRTVTDIAPDLPTSVGWTISGRSDGFTFDGLVDEVRVSSAAIESNDLSLDVYKGPKDARTLAYDNTGDLTSGGYAVDPSTGSPTSIDGTGTIPSTVSGDATVTFHVTFDAGTLRWTGTAVIDDPGGGFTATIPVHSGRHGITRSGTVVSGTLWGIKALSVPRKCFMILFAIDQG
jgi:hypothetical protein